MRTRQEQPDDEIDDLDVVDPETAEEETPQLVREVGTTTEVAAIPFEVRKDGSIAYFTHEATTMREAGS